MWRMLAVNFPSILDRSTAEHTCVSISPVVGDSPRIGSLVVKSRGFVGVHREFTVSRIFSRRRFSRAIFRNRGFPTFPLGQYPQGRRIPANSHAGYGRTGANREIPTVLPHQPHTTARIPASPASTDTDSRLSVVGGLSRLIGRVSEMRKPRFHTESGFLWLRAGSIR